MSDELKVAEMPSGGVRKSQLETPLLPVLAEVPSAKREMSVWKAMSSSWETSIWKEMSCWELILLFVSVEFYSLCGQVPLYGFRTFGDSDPFSFPFLRCNIGSYRGNVTELGIVPIVTTGLVMELLGALKIIRVDKNDKKNRALLSGAQKLLGVLITIVEAGAYVLSGMCGDVDEMGARSAKLTIVQLFFAGIFMIFFTPLPRKGYGLYRIIVLYPMVNIWSHALD